VFLYSAVSLGVIVALFHHETVGLSATRGGAGHASGACAVFLLARRFGTLAGVRRPRLFAAVGR
jgi:hypothetical protein